MNTNLTGSSRCRLILVVTLLGVCASWATTMTELSKEEMTQVVGEWTTDKKCTVGGVMVGQYPQDGNTCEPTPLPDGVCAGTCAHSIWGCCWDPGALRCHAAMAQTGGACALPLDGWECRDTTEGCDPGTGISCCWFTYVGERIGDTCYSGSSDCIDPGYAECDYRNCEQNQVTAGE